MKKAHRGFLLVAILFISVAILAACGGASAVTASPTRTPLPTIPPTAVRPTPDINAYLQMDLEGGDQQHGTNVAIAFECKPCHAGGRTDRAPRFTATDDMPPIMERGEQRIADPTYQGQATTNLEYILESIFIPEAHVVPGEWVGVMQDDFAETIKDEDLPHLLAWLETFSESAVAGDPDRGREIFMNGGAHDNYKPSNYCSSCHSLDGSEDRGPTLLGIAVTAAERVPGLSAEEYIHQSIMDPGAYVVEGFKQMGRISSALLSEQELKDVIAFLMTQTSMDSTTETTGVETDIDLAMALPDGDPLVGELTALNFRCIGCHDNNTYPNVNGPEFAAGEDLPPIIERSELRIADPAYTGRATSGQEYIIESILDPATYLLPGDWLEVMPDTYHEELTTQDLADLVAWIETFSEKAASPSAAPPPDPTPDINPFLQIDLSEGDALRGRNAALKYRCHGCHAGDDPAYGPPFVATADLPYILERGELRIADPAYEGQAASNHEYLIESIFNPAAYVLPGDWEEAMPDTYHLRITDTELANIIAWIQSLE
jgi:cytochrome c2